MIHICDECGKPIVSEWFWKRWNNGKIVFVCNRCAANMIDDRSCNGLISICGGEQDGKDNNKNVVVNMECRSGN